MEEFMIYEIPEDLNAQFEASKLDTTMHVGSDIRILISRIARDEAILKRIGFLLEGWREAVVELEDFCSEPVRLKNMLAAADQIDEVARDIRTAMRK
jgi:hypothetical protein